MNNICETIKAKMRHRWCADLCLKFAKLSIDRLNPPKRGENGLLPLVSGGQCSYFGNTVTHEARQNLVISAITGTVQRQIDDLTGAISESLFEPVIRLGVTGLARSGKTVFITSLVANLLDRGRMAGFLPVAEGRISAVYPQPQPSMTVPRFDYETHLADMTGTVPKWPESTRSISELRLSVKVRPKGMLAGLSGDRTVHIDIIDYPGEWLLDLPLLDQTYSQWSLQTFARMRGRASATEFLQSADKVDAAAAWDEATAKSLASQFTAYLHAARNDGFYDVTPGRFLLPGDLDGSPALTFAPLPALQNAPRKSMWREMERRFEAYKTKVIKPFYRDHFSRIDRQIVLVDVLGAIHTGPKAVEDLRAAMAEIMRSFRPGKNAFLSQILMGRRVDKILFAATKADHLHHSQHPQLTAIIEALTRDARDRARFAGAQTEAMSIAALRTTEEQRIPHGGRDLDVVRGVLMESGKTAVLYPGELPSDPSKILGQAREGAEKWLDQDYNIMRFAPVPVNLGAGNGPPHIRLDKAAQFLFGDRL